MFFQYSYINFFIFQKSHAVEFGEFPFVYPQFYHVKKNSGIILEMSIRFYFYHIISLSPTQEMNKKTMISHTCILHVLFALK